MQRLIKWNQMVPCILVLSVIFAVPPPHAQAQFIDGGWTSGRVIATQVSTNTTLHDSGFVDSAWPFAIETPASITGAHASAVASTTGPIGVSVASFDADYRASASIFARFYVQQPMTMFLNYNLAADPDQAFPNKFVQLTEVTPDGPVLRAEVTNGMGIIPVDVSGSNEFILVAFNGASGGTGAAFADVHTQPIPEPATAAWLALLGLAMARRR